MFYFSCERILFGFFFGGREQLQANPCLVTFHNIHEKIQTLHIILILSYGNQSFLKSLLSSLLLRKLVYRVEPSFIVYYFSVICWLLQNVRLRVDKVADCFIKCNICCLFDMFNERSRETVGLKQTNKKL